jgi:EmrB/QacA subfamily drug resistance transporter
MPTIPPTAERRTAILALVCAAQFMVVLDMAIVNLALPSIQTDLGFDDAGLQWVVNAYTIAFAGLLLFGGRAADLYGQRRLFMIGLGIFGIASLVAGIAQDSAVLVAARGLQGIGGAVLSPATLTILITTFTEPRERARAMGVWSALAGAGGAAGALLGGVFTELLSWRWVFFINIPIAVVAIVVAVRLLRTRNQRHATQLDAIGATLATAGLVALVYGIVSIEQHALGSLHVAGGVVAGVVLLAWFLLHEHFVAKEPLMPLRLWRSSSLAIANLTMFLISCGMFAMWFLVSLDLQNVRGYSPFDAGLAFLPQTFAIIVAAQISSRLLGRVGARPLVFVACVMAAAGLYWCSTFSETGSFLSTYLVPGVMIAFGLGLAMTPIVASATTNVRPQEAGLASGLISTSRQIGGSLGLATLATIAANRAADVARTEPVRVANHTGYTEGFAWAAALLGVAAITSLWLPSVRNRRQSVPAEAEVSPQLADA